MALTHRRLRPTSLAAIAVILISSWWGLVCSTRHPSAADATKSRVIDMRGRELRKASAGHGVRNNVATGGSSGGGRGNDGDNKEILTLAQTPPMG